MACQTHGALQHKSVVQRVDTRRWLGLVVALFATFMGYLDTSIVNVSAPSLEKDLHISFAEVQLVIAGYTLAYAVLLATGGRLGDLYGRKRLAVAARRRQ
jgi:MFS family permease